MDYDKIKGSPCVRTRKQGDYLVVNSAGGRKKLNRVFIDEKIPAGLRGSDSGCCHRIRDPLDPGEDE